MLFLPTFTVHSLLRLNVDVHLDDDDDDDDDEVFTLTSLVFIILRFLVLTTDFVIETVHNFPGIMLMVTKVYAVLQSADVS